ncbi:MAG: hypothetical protein AAB739_03010 [Patescibacteria group bacterium]
MNKTPERPDIDRVPPAPATPDSSVSQIQSATTQHADHALSGRETPPDDYRKVTVADFQHLSMQQLMAYSNTSARDKDWPACILFRTEITGRCPTPLNYSFLSMALENSGCVLPALTYRLAAQYLDPRDKTNNGKIARLQDLLSTPRVKFVDYTLYSQVTPEIMDRCTTKDLIIYGRTAAGHEDTERAIFFRQEIVRREPYDFDNRVCFAGSLEAASRLIEAIEQREAAQKLNPHDTMNNEKLVKLCKKIQNVVI